MLVHLSEVPKPDMVISVIQYEAFILPKFHPTPKYRIRTEADCLGTCQLVDDSEEFFRCDFSLDKIGVDTALHSEA